MHCCMWLRTTHKYDDFDDDDVHVYLFIPIYLWLLLVLVNDLEFISL